MHSEYEKTIFKVKDEYGDIRVTEANLIRSLYFGNNIKQSLMLMPEPGVLLLKYAQAMASALMFCNNKPKKILIAGLGGGSLLHFFLKSCPTATIEAVELRKSVINIARKYFFVPENASRISIIHDDAKSYVKLLTREHAETYDIILIDAFSQWGPADVNHDKPFILNCQSLLNNQGIIGFSLWNRKEDQFHTIHRRMCSLFNENLLSLSLGKRDSNVVLFGFKNDYPLKNIRAAEMRAARLLLDWGINFPNYMKLIQIQNLSLLKNIKKHFSVTL